MPNFKDLTGQRFGRLDALWLSSRDERGKALWFCLCECGTEKAIRGDALTSGATTSCGCAVRKHGHTPSNKLGRKPTQTYRTWQAMKERCTLPTNKAFKHYGARGITVCDRWLDSFENFLADMGERPPGLTLDRKNNDGNYEPSNCRWATQTEQVNNSRRWPK